MEEGDSIINESVILMITWPPHLVHSVEIKTSEAIFKNIIFKLFFILKETSDLQFGLNITFWSLPNP